MKTITLGHRIAAILRRKHIKASGLTYAQLAAVIDRPALSFK